MKPKNINTKQWAYFSPDGYVQVRSISDTKKLCREMVAYREYDHNDNKITYRDYEKNGYVMRKVVFKITVC